MNLTLKGNETPPNHNNRSRGAGGVWGVSATRTAVVKASGANRKLAEWFKMPHIVKLDPNAKRLVAAATPKQPDENDLP